MADYAHEQTDKIIEKMEKQVAKEYKQAEKELTKKIKDYLKKFEEKDKAKQKQLADGQITQEEYNNWKIGQIATGDRWKAMRDTLAEEITKANDIAKSTINGHMEDVYSLNHNYATYQVEKDAMIDTSYTLYNRRSTEELFKNKKSLLPAPKEGTKAWQAAHNKDLRWNQQKINSSMIQGILQGDSIPQIAKRLREVVGMNSRSAMRNARTMTTSIENKGRDDAYSELREKGIELETVWIATLDDRTRHSHRLLHGEIRDEKTGKYSNGLRYPADPMGEPEEVYNCRCAETSYVKGFPVDIPKWSPKMGDMTYEEWLGVKEDDSLGLQEDQHVVVNGEDILSTWQRRSDQFDFAIDDVINAQGFDGLPKVVNEEEFERIINENNIICKRGYNVSFESKGEDAEEVLNRYHEDLVNGKWYVDCHVGGADYGQGMYSYINFNQSEGISVMDEAVRFYSGDTGRIEEFTLDSNARIIKSSELQELKKAEKDRIKENYSSMISGSNLNEVEKDIAERMAGLKPTWDKSGSKAISIYEKMSDDDQSRIQDIVSAYNKTIREETAKISKMDDGVYATLKGYDAIQADYNLGNNTHELVILNRTKVIFKSG